MNDAHFSVATRLTRLLGETYRSSEAALKELVDNAWDADAHNVWISLPEPLTTDPVVVHDDGSGMTPMELQREYLNIASDKRARTGVRTPRLGRKIKGRKGIGKFAGLTLANEMRIEAVSRGTRSTLTIDKERLIASQGDLEAVPLPFEALAVEGAAPGTIITLAHLDQRLNFPSTARLRQVLIYEYGREEGFKVHVNGVPLSVEDVPGATTQLLTELEHAGRAELRFTIADGKRTPTAPGIILKVNGKSIGKPQFFGLDEDEEIPTKLLRRLYGEVEIDGLEEHVTADWGGILDNSIAFQVAAAHVQFEVKKALEAPSTAET